MSETEPELPLAEPAPLEEPAPLAAAAPLEEPQIVEPSPDFSDFDVLDSEIFQKKKKRGRPRKSQAEEFQPKMDERTSDPDAPSASASPQVTIEKKELGSRKLGEKLATVGIEIIGGMSDGKFRPTGETEKKLEKDVVTSAGTYFEAKGFRDLPPGWALVLSTCVLYSAMAMAERNRPLRENLWVKVRGWFGKKKKPE